jgi:hypothetical protein
MPWSTLRTPLGWVQTGSPSSGTQNLGLSKREIIRCLKRYLAREIFNALPILVAENHSAHSLAKP